MTTSIDDLDTLSTEDFQRGGNVLLGELGSDDLLPFRYRAHRVTLARGDELSRPNENIATAYFIESGVASIIRPGRSGRKTEICLLGREALSGGAIITADGRWPYLTIVQSKTLRAIKLSAEALRSAAAQSEGLHTLIVRSMHVVMIQIAEGLVGASEQTMQARLARWLLMYRDRLGSDNIEVTHEFIAIMIGAQRTGVTLTLHELEGAGMIAASRGLIVLKDVGALGKLADDSYGTPEDEHERLVAAPIAR